MANIVLPIKPARSHVISTWANKTHLVAQLAHELGNVAVAGPRIATEQDEHNNPVTRLLDLARRDQASAVRKLYELEHHARIIRTGAYLIVVEIGV